MISNADYMLVHRDGSTASYVVGALTGDYFTHVAKVVNEFVIIEADVLRGVIPSPITRYTQDENATVLFCRIKGMTAEERRVLNRFCLKRVGRGYDYLQLLFIIISLKLKAGEQVFNLINKIRPNQICSEPISDGARQLGYNLAQRLKPFEVRPQHLCPAGVHGGMNKFVEVVPV
jgi:hypothetical protein